MSGNKTFASSLEDNYKKYKNVENTYQMITDNLGLQEQAKLAALLFNDEKVRKRLNLIT